MKQLWEWIFLICIAIASGVFWRLEIEYFGWEGLIWITYFPKTIFLGTLLYGLFLTSDVRLTINERIIHIIFICLIGAAIVYLFRITMGMLYNRFWFYSSIVRILLLSLSIVIFLSPSFITYWHLKIIKLNPQKKYLILSIGLMIFSIFISCYLLDLINHKGGADEIHAFKSGIIIPFLMVSIGVQKIATRFTN